MGIEKQVSSHELSKLLKKYGVNQESIFWWIKRNDGSIFVSSAYGCDCWVELPYDNEIFCSAFIATELGNLLPTNLNSWGLCINATSYLTNNGIKSLWHITYADYDKKLMNEISDLNLCNAMAKMLIYLIEHKLIDKDDISECI